MSPLSLAGIIVGGLFVGAVAVAAYLDWQDSQERAAERMARAYYDGWEGER